MYIQNHLLIGFISIFFNAHFGFVAIVRLYYTILHIICVRVTKTTLILLECNSISTCKSAWFCDISIKLYHNGLYFCQIFFLFCYAATYCVEISNMENCADIKNSETWKSISLQRVVFRLFFHSINLHCCSICAHKKFVCKICNSIFFVCMCRTLKLLWLQVLSFNPFECILMVSSIKWWA